MIIYDNRPDKVKVIEELKNFTVDELICEILDNKYMEVENYYGIKVFDNAYFEEDMIAPLFGILELDELQRTAQVLVMHIFEELIVLMIA